MKVHKQQQAANMLVQRSRCVGKILTNVVDHASEQSDELHRLLYLRMLHLRRSVARNLQPWHGIGNASSSWSPKDESLLLSCPMPSLTLILINDGHGKARETMWWWTGAGDRRDSPSFVAFRCEMLDVPPV